MCLLLRLIPMDRINVSGTLITDNNIYHTGSSRFFFFFYFIFYFFFFYFLDTVDMFDIVHCINL